MCTTTVKYTHVVEYHARIRWFTPQTVYFTSLVTYKHNEVIPVRVMWLLYHNQVRSRTLWGITHYPQRHCWCTWTHHTLFRTLLVQRMDTATSNVRCFRRWSHFSDASIFQQLRIPDRLCTSGWSSFILVREEALASATTIHFIGTVWMWDERGKVAEPEWWSQRREKRGFDSNRSNWKNKGEIL